MDLTGWTPAYAYSSGGHLMLDWCYTGQRRFSEPFFGDTIDRVTADRAVFLFRHQTTVEEAAESSRRRPGLAPSGLIFHMSRCGSTLVSQMLAAIPENRVLSEPTPLNAVIRAALLDPGIPRTTLVDWVRTVTGLLGCPLEGETRYFLKLDCWHVLALPLLIEAFPETPWIFLYRNPAEVLVSQVRAPGAWAVRSALDPRVFGLHPEERPEEAGAISQSEYRARALSRMCSVALEHRGCGHGLLVNYEELPGFVWTTLPRHFDFTLSAGELDRFQSVSRADAKTPALTFSDDRTVKRREVTPALQCLVERWLTPLYERLEKARERQLRHG